MVDGINRGRALGFVLVALLLVSQGAAARDKLPFRYVGGTQGPSETCRGALETSSNELTFRCGAVAITVPYSSIILMQYRADVSRKVRRMKLRWSLVPPGGGGGAENRYFTLIYDDGSGGRAGLVLEVSSENMRPYLAEIDLYAGRRVDVQSHETYGYR